MSGEENKKMECLHPGDPRVCVLLGKQPIIAGGKQICWSNFVYRMDLEGQTLLFHTLTRKLYLIHDSAFMMHHYFDDTVSLPLYSVAVLDDKHMKRLYEDYFLVPEGTDESRLYLQVKNILVIKEELPKGITTFIFSFLSFLYVSSNSFKV